MRVLIDACVLFPTVLREIVLDLAATGAFQPLWSPRILGEWRHAAARRGQVDGDVAETEIARETARFPSASVEVTAKTEYRLSLPDPDDVHVLAAAVDGHADELLTLNLRDFPTNALAAEGIIRRDPDGFLLEFYHADPDRISGITRQVLDRAAKHGIDTSSPRAVLKRARLPRLAKALYQP